jgi:hypothetical protein
MSAVSLPYFTFVTSHLITIRLQDIQVPLITSMTDDNQSTQVQPSVSSQSSPSPGEHLFNNNGTLHEGDDGVLGGDDPSSPVQESVDGEYDDNNDAWVMGLARQYGVEYEKRDLEEAAKSLASLWDWQNTVENEFTEVSWPFRVR